MYSSLDNFVKNIKYLFNFQKSRTSIIYTVCGIKIKFKRNQKKSFKKLININHKKYLKKHNLVIERLKKDFKFRKFRVCFLVQETQKWNMQSLYDKMKVSDSFEPFLVVTKLKYNENDNSYKHCIEFFKKRCKNVEIGYDELNNKYIDLKTFSPDIVFFQQPWGLHENQNAIYVSNFALPYYFPYAISEAPSCIGLNLKSFFIVLQKHFIFSREDEMLLDYLYGYKNYNLSIVGHPKLDVYSNYKEVNNRKRFIIYAPHHSLGLESLNYGTFKWNGKYILEWAKLHPEFEWVFKPHPRLKTVLINEKIMSKEEAEKYYNEWKDIGIYYDDGDYFDIFKNSQCLITDCGSFLIEFLPTEQPVIHLRSMKARDYTASNEHVMKTYYKAWNIKQLDELLNEILIKKNDFKKQERINVLKNLNIKNYSATDKIIHELKKDLGIATNIEEI